MGALPTCRKCDSPPNVAALEQGRVDAGITTPNLLMLLQKRRPGTLVLFDRPADDTFRKIFGVARYPSHVLYARLDWIEHNEQTVRSIAKPVVRALRYIEMNSPAVIASKMPMGSRSPDSVSDVQALKIWKSMYSRDGITPPSSFEAVKAVTSLSIDKVRSTTPICFSVLCWHAWPITAA